MENAQLISLSRQIGLQRQMNVVANNLANINTVGFKAEEILFGEVVDRIARDQAFPPGDQELIFTEDWATMHDLRSGAITPTGNPLDVALQGDGFLTVQGLDGAEFFTRSGQLTLDSTGTLVDHNGFPVLGEGGPIRIGPTETDLAISANGTITTSAGLKGKLRIAEFENPQALDRAGANLWTGGIAIPATNTQVVQGAVERSNVSGISEMTEMIRVQRAYQNIASMMERQDELRRSAVQKLGDLAA